MTANPAKDAGTKFERDVCALAEALGLPAFRPRPEGLADVGDIHGLDPAVGQCKTGQNLTTAIRDGVDGALAQAKREGLPYGLAFVKRARLGVADSYAVTTTLTALQILARLQRAENLLAHHRPDLYRWHLQRSREDTLPL